MSDALETLLAWYSETPSPDWWGDVDSDLRAPFPWFGGKSRAAALIWERLGHVVNYVEPFAGSLAVLLARPHEPRVETVNDIDGMLVNFWRATQEDPEAVARAADWPVNEADLHARHRYLTRIKRTLAARLEADPFYFNAAIAGWWVWGLSAWIGSGWCEDVENRKRPNIGGRGETSSGSGSGVHGRRMRVTLGGASSGMHRKVPSLGGAPTKGDGSQGVHGQGMRRQMPDLGGSTKGEARFANGGKGVNGFGMRRQLPYLAGGNVGEPCIGQGVNNHGARSALYDVFETLARRLRYTRVTCGDFARILTPSVTWKHGLTGVLLDPPYEGFDALYGTEAVSARVRAWCVENGARPDLRIALCGYAGEHDALEALGWTVEAWKAHGGYGNQGGDNENARRERIWFSPACIRRELAVGPLFAAMGGV